jgi:excisionase family DNA binding protein
MSNQDTDLLTTKEAADLLRHTDRTLIRWRNERKGPGFVKCGKKVLYRRSDLVGWLESQHVEMIRGVAAS